MTSLPRVALTALALLLPGAAFACPNVGLSGQALTYSSDDAWTPRSHGVTAGGQENLSACLNGAAGNVAAAPDFELTFTGNGSGRALEFRVNANCDTVLLVNSANGEWLYNDDDIDLNPRIRLAAAPEGLYDIWIGTYGSELCNAELTIETF